MQAQQPQLLQQQFIQQQKQQSAQGIGADDTEILSRRRLVDLLRQVSGTDSFDPDAEDFVMDLVDNFVENVVLGACRFALHRESSTLDAPDVALYLDRVWNIHVPPNPNSPSRLSPPPVSDATKSRTSAAPVDFHRQRLALIHKHQRK